MLKNQFISTKKKTELLKIGNNNKDINNAKRNSSKAVFERLSRSASEGKMEECHQYRQWIKTGAATRRHSHTKACEQERFRQVGDSCRRRPRSPNRADCSAAQLRAPAEEHGSQRSANQEQSAVQDQVQMEEDC